MKIILVVLSLFCTNGCMTYYSLTTADGVQTEFAVYGQPRHIVINSPSGESAEIRHDPSFLNNVELGLRLALNFLPW